MKCLTTTAATAIAIAGFLFSVPSAKAIATLRVSADLGATWVTVRDIDGDGQVEFSGSIGTVGNTWSVSVAAGQTRPAVGSSSDAIMNVSTLGVASLAAGTLIVEFSERSYTTPMPGDYFSTSLNSENTGAGGTTLMSYWDANNSMFGRTTRLGRITQTGDQESTVASAGALPTTGLYSLTMRLTIFHDGAGSSSFSSSLVDPPAVPEGGTTIAMLGFAVLLLSVLVRRTASSVAR